MKDTIIMRNPEIIAQELAKAKMALMCYQQTNVCNGHGGIDELKSIKLSLASDKTLSCVNNLTNELREAVIREANNA